MPKAFNLGEMKFRIELKEGKTIPELIPTWNEEAILKFEEEEAEGVYEFNLPLTDQNCVFMPNNIKKE